MNMKKTSGAVIAAAVLAVATPMTGMVQSLTAFAQSAEAADEYLQLMVL